MPSIRKRIGYLPSINTQEVITTIAKKEKLSQSKVVGILVEEALIARGIFDHKDTDDLISKNRNSNLNNINNLSCKYSDLDELISDKGITYNIKKYNRNQNTNSGETIGAYNQELFEQFKQFILFQKMIEENNKNNL